MNEPAERHEFQTEVRELLDLMIHSLYSHKDIFLRELISNASDALDKVRFESVSRPELAPMGELEIRLEVDADARTLAVYDNGIGMSREEVVENLGTIARSGTREFLERARAASKTMPAADQGRHGRELTLLLLLGFQLRVIRRDECPDIVRHSQQFKPLLFI